MIRTLGSKLLRLPRTGLFWLAISYLAVGLAYAWVTPVFEKPDEDGHYGYPLYLREHRRLPPLTFSEGFPSEYKQPPLYYLVVTGLTGWLPDVPDPSILLETNPYMEYSVPGYREDNRNVFLHPPHLTPVVLGARLVSLLFGLGTVVGAYRLALSLYPKDSLVPIATATLVGFQPQFIYVATAVNNDAAIAFLGAWIVVLLVHRLRRGGGKSFPILLGILLGLASITKVSGLIFLPLAGLGLLFIHRGVNRSLLREGILVLLVALLIGGWWYLRNGLVYSDPLSIGTHTAGYDGTRPFWDRLRHDLTSIEHSLWANPSRTFVSRTWIDAVFVWWGRISLGLLVLGQVAAIRSSSGKHRLAQILILAWPTTFLLLLLGYWTRRSSWAYGRLLFPAIAPLGLGFAAGWWHTLPARARRLGLTATMGLFITCTALIPLVSIRPLYHPWRPWQEGAAEHPVGITYARPGTGSPVARLLGYGLPEPVTTPGAYVPVELCWEPLARTDVPYAVFIQILDTSRSAIHGAPGIVGGRRTYPGLGNLPTTRWRIGQAFCDRLLIQVSPDAPTPLGASLEVGLIGEGSDQRLQAVDDAGVPIDAPFLRGMTVLPDGGLPAIEGPARFVLDGAIGLGQVQVHQATDASLTVSLTWQSLQAVPYDATVFVHLQDEQGRTLAQADRPPLGGQFPTSHWVPGQVVLDRVILKPETGTAQRPTVVTIGMYTWPSLARLSIVDAAGAPLPNDAISIPVPSLAPGEEVRLP